MKVICVVLYLKNGFHVSGTIINEHLFFFSLVVLGTKPRALCMLSMGSTTDLYTPSPDSLTLVLNLSAWYFRKLGSYGV